MSTKKRILCPIDFSEFNQSANEFASLIAESAMVSENDEAEITYLHVAQPEVAWGTYAYFDEKKENARHMEKLRDYSPLKTGISSNHIVRWGIPADRITSYAAKNKIDLIVIGTHGRTGLLRTLMGSVAEAVVRKAPCPVMVVKKTANVTQMSN